MTKTKTQADAHIRIWVAAFTAPNVENSVADLVRAMDYSVLLPTAVVEMRHARRTMMVDRPVFPRYVFIGIPHERSWYPLKTVSGLGGILSQNGVPQPMHVKSVDLLKKAIEADAFLVEDKSPFKEGDKVKVSIGMGEVEAFVEKVIHTLPARRVDIMFSMFGKEHRQNLSVDQVRAA